MHETTTGRECLHRRGSSARRFLTLLLLPTIVVAAVRPAAGQAPAKPKLDRRIPHPLAEPGAGPPDVGSSYGWVMAAGKVGAVGTDALDDLVIASISQNFMFGSTDYIDLGAVYTYVDANLAHHPVHPQLLPAVLEEHDALMGVLAMAVGDVRGTAQSPQTNLLFAPCHKRKQTCGTEAVEMGAVDVFDLTAAPGSPPPATSNALKLTIVPPAYDNGLDPEDDQASEVNTCHIQWFGHSLALGDVDGDGYSDLIVGAAATYEEAVPTPANHEGRIYIFFGHPHFLDPSYQGRPGYLYRWLGVKAPQVSPANPDRFPSGGMFGISVATSDLDQDGHWDVVVGRYERYSPTTGPFPGRAHVFWGSYLSDLAPWTTGGNRLEAPLPAPDPSTGVPGAYETLTDDQGRDGGWFGWIVYAFDRDLGGPGYGTSGARLDIGVHSEDANYLNAQGGIITPKVGSLLVYFGNWTTTDNSLVDQAQPVRLQFPLNTGMAPQQGERFGRSAVSVEWRDSAVPAHVVTSLLVSSPDRAIRVGTEMREHAGCVVCFKAPLSNAPGGKDNAWGTFVLKEPKDSIAEQMAIPIDDESDMEAQALSTFGGWMVKLRYNSGFAGDQIVISARERQLGGFAKVGQVYTLHLTGP
jgi:hypothetical protein